jgi:phospholipase C
MPQPLPGIDHIVVLMLENRSFDNLFGGLYPAGPGFHGLTGKESNDNPIPPGAGTWTVWQAPPGSATGAIPNPDPGEEFTDMNTQLFGTPTPSSCPIATMAGFAANYARQPGTRPTPGYPSTPPVPRNIMQYFSAQTVPVSYTLARHYAVSDVWYAAAPVQTLSNRVFTHTGTPSKLPKPKSPRPTQPKSRINNGDFTSGLSFSKIIEGDFVAPVIDTTIFELLDRANPARNAPVCSDFCDKDPRLNWKVYYHDAPLSSLCEYVYQHWCFGSLYGGNVFRYREHFSSETNFEYDIRKGLLPTYSFIEPAYTSVEYTANSNHPGGAIPDPLDLNAQNFQPPINIDNGEKLLAEIYTSLAKHPGVFDRTLLIVTYDEHGGVYDHVPPGSAVSPFVTPVSNFNYDRTGVRVPAILINPRIATKVFRPTDGQQVTGRCGTFVTQLDHTSIIKTLCAQFGLGAPPTPRAASVPTLAGLIKPTSDSAHAPLHDLMAAAATEASNRRNAPRDLGTSARIRAWYGQRKEDGFPGNQLNNAVFATSAIAWNGRLRATSYPLREIVDLSADAEDALHAADIRDTGALLAAITATRGTEHVAALTGQAPSRVQHWAEQAELLRVPGILGDDAHLLAAAGIHNREQLAKVAPEDLHERMLSVAKNLSLDGFFIEPKVMAAWVEAAAC